jgi:hypothetical protein
MAREMATYRRNQGLGFNNEMIFDSESDVRSLDLNNGSNDLASNSNTESRPPIRNREFESLCQKWGIVMILQYPRERWSYPQRKRRQVLGRTGCP